MCLLDVETKCRVQEIETMHGVVSAGFVSQEQVRRREAARAWRDQQIAELSALTNRTHQQDEQLRALRLEREFQRRAEEAAQDEDDDEQVRTYFQDHENRAAIHYRSLNLERL